MVKLFRGITIWRSPHVLVVPFGQKFVYLLVWYLMHFDLLSSNRDLSMILDALLKTKSRTVLVDIINKNGNYSVFCCQLPQYSSITFLLVFCIWTVFFTN